MAKFFQSKMNSYTAAAPSDATVAPEHADADAHTAEPVDVTRHAPTVAEIVAAIKGMHSHAAGVDGIPTALFKQWAPRDDSSDEHE
jgi:hypothetical protein